VTPLCEDFDADYTTFSDLYAKKMWPEAVQAGTSFRARWAEESALSDQQRERLASALLCGVDAVARESHACVGIAEQAFQQLEEFIAWVRRQPERAFRAFEAEALVERMRWYGERDDAMDSLEALVELVIDQDSPTFTKVTCKRVAGNIHQLSHMSSDDQRRYEATVEEALEGDGGGMPDPDDIGVSDATTARQERLAEAFLSFAEQLDIDDDDEAAELRAVMLIAAVTATGRLGDVDKAHWLLEQLAALGDSAITAFNTMISEADTLGKQAGGLDTAATVAASMMGKIGLLLMHGDKDGALVAATEIVDRFEHRREKVIAAIVHQAFELQQFILNDLVGGHDT